MYRYFVYGLNIESAVVLSDLPPGGDVPDVSILLGAAPESLPEVDLQGMDFQATSNQVLLNIEGVARYLMTDGNRITVDPAPGGNKEDLRTFLLGSSFGALLHQRGLLPLHASAVAVGEGCAVFMAPPEGGKSAIAAALNQRGYRVLADDISVVTANEGETALVHPGLPYVKVREDVARELGIDPKALPRVHAESEKRVVPLRGRLLTTPLPLLRAYVLSWSDLGDLRLEPVEGVEKAFAYVGNTYQPMLLVGECRKTEHFRKCLQLGRQAALKRISRPSTLLTVKQVVDLLQKDLER